MLVITYQYEGMKNVGDVVGVEALRVVSFLPETGAIAVARRPLLIDSTPSSQGWITQLQAVLI